MRLRRRASCWLEQVARRALDSTPTGLFTTRGRQISRETYICLPSIPAIYLAKTKRPPWTPISRSGEFIFFFLYQFLLIREWSGGFLRYPVYLLLILLFATFCRL
jgi:hypothetical protein